MSITNFTELFWSSDAYFGKQDNTYISSLYFRKFLASPDLSDSLLMGSGSDAAEPMFPE